MGLSGWGTVRDVARLCQGKLKLELRAVKTPTLRRGGGILGV